MEIVHIAIVDAIITLWKNVFLIGFHIPGRPLADAQEHRQGRLPFFRQGVFHPRRNFIELFPMNNVVGYHLFEGEASTASVILAISLRKVL